jgi:hypothetical protein
MGKVRNGKVGVGLDLSTVFGIFSCLVCRAVRSSSSALGFRGIIKALATIPAIINLCRRKKKRHRFSFRRI